jgi:hypothetical protein
MISNDGALMAKINEAVKSAGLPAVTYLRRIEERVDVRASASILEVWIRAFYNAFCEVMWEKRGISLEYLENHHFLDQLRHYVWSLIFWRTMMVYEFCKDYKDGYDTAEIKDGQRVRINSAKSVVADMGRSGRYLIPGFIHLLIHHIGWVESQDGVYYYPYFDDPSFLPMTPSMMRQFSERWFEPIQDSHLTFGRTVSKEPMGNPETMMCFVINERTTVVGHDSSASQPLMSSRYPNKPHTSALLAACLGLQLNRTVVEPLFLYGPEKAYEASLLTLI